MQIIETESRLLLFLIIASIGMMTTGIFLCMNYRRRRLFVSSLRRAVRWEFWPMWLFYMPTVFYIVILSIRHKGLLFTAANPGLPGGGFIGEHKTHALTLLQKASPNHVARFELLPVCKGPEKGFEQSLAFMQIHQLDFPIVLKPEFGQRGFKVAIIRSQQAIKGYLASATVDTIIQEHIKGYEFGVFYVRMPNQAKGRIFSITEKCFPEVVGDGQRNLERLILDTPRTHYMARYLLKLHRRQLNEVLPQGQRMAVVELGTHSLGSLFLDGVENKTPALEERIDQVSKGIPGFYFGRYDIRAPSIEAFQAGKEFKVVEVNGVTSEATHIYDPKYNVLTAYKVLREQWRLAFEIGRQNIEQGHSKTSPLVLFNKVRHMKRA